MPHASAFAKLPRNTAATLIAMAMGFALGIGATAAHLDVASIAEVASSIGGFWSAALRMTVIPLVVCLLIGGLAGSSGKLVGRLGAISVVIFVTMLIIGALFASALTPPLLHALNVQPGVLAGAVPSTAAAPVERSTGNDLLTVIAVTIVVALAMTRIDDERRQRVLALVDALLATIMVILSWILTVMPFAVFALSFAAGAHSGFSAARAFLAFAVIVSILLILFTLALYPTATFFGSVSLRRFASAALGAQTVAVATRSSVASLPALLESGARLGLPASVNAFVMPLCVSVFKANRTISGMVKLFFLAYICGVPLSMTTILAYAGTLVLVSFASPGLPSGGLFTSTAPLLAAGIPMGAIVMAHAVDDLPDVFKTVANVTADLTVGAIVTKHAGVVESASEAPSVVESAA